MCGVLFVIGLSSLVETRVLKKIVVHNFQPSFPEKILSSFGNSGKRQSVIMIELLAFLLTRNDCLLK